MITDLSNKKGEKKRMEEENWKTHKERLHDWIFEADGEFHVKDLMRELEYKDLQSLLDDFNFIARKLKREGKRISVSPVECLHCGYIMNFNSGSIKIPSKCPQCHQERFNLPMIKIENKL